VFNGLEDRVEERWLEVSGLISTLKDMDRSQVASAITQLKVLLSYQLTIVASGQSLLSAYDAALSALGPG
jgi:hypothetical protein